jgi:hypothetical protein
VYALFGYKFFSFPKLLVVLVGVVTLSVLLGCVWYYQLSYGPII